MSGINAPAQLAYLTGNGTTAGLITLASTAGFYIGSRVWLYSNVLDGQEYLVISQTETQLGLRLASSPSYGTSDVSGYLVADTSIISADEQFINSIDPNADPVTLGTANGLSLFGQELSLRTADTTHAGALSAADYTAFSLGVGGGLTTLTGDVTASGSGSAVATVAFVGTSSAANVHAAELLANAATNANTASTIVKRNASGNFTAGTVTADLDKAAGTLNVGASATTINIGGASSTVVIAGTLLSENTTNTTILDKLITLNKGGAASSATGSGIEVEEGGSITGYEKISVDRNSWTFKVPGTAGVVTITPGAAGFTLDSTSGAPVTLTAVGSSPAAEGASLSGQALTLQPASLTLPGVVTAGTQSFGGIKTFGEAINLASSSTAVSGASGIALRSNAGVFEISQNGEEYRSIITNTASALTLYVNASTGSNSNTGLSAGAALLTIQAAIDKIPKRLTHQVTINVAAGTYAENVSLSGFIFAGSTAPFITITGTMGTFTPTTGTSSGTITSEAAVDSGIIVRRITDSTQNWTVNELRGHFVGISGTYYPIVGNTATTIDIVKGNTSSGAYTINTPSSIMDGTLTISRNSVGITTNSVSISRMAFAPTTTTVNAITGGGSNGATTTFTECEIKRLGGSSNTPLISAAGFAIATPPFVFSRSSAVNTSSGTSPSALSTSTGAISIAGSYFYCSSGSLYIGVVQAISSSFVAITTSCIETGSSTGSAFSIAANGGVSGLKISPTGARFVLPSGSTGSAISHLIYNATGGTPENSYPAFPVTWQMSNTVSTFPLEFVNGNVGFHANGNIKLHCTLDSAPMEMYFTNVTTAFSIGRGAQVLIGSGSSPIMSGVTNEIKIDGNVYSIAQLDAMPGKTIKNSQYGTLFTRGNVSGTTYHDISAPFANSSIEEIARISRVGGDTSQGTNRAAALSFYDASNPTLTGAVAGIREAANSDYNGGLAFYVANGEGTATTLVSSLAEKMRISKDGYVGIGTSTPSVQLHTTGGVRFATFGTAGILHNDATGVLTSSLISLTTDVTGVLPVANGGSTGTNTGDVTLTAVGIVPSASGASISGQQLTLQPADATHPGVMVAADKVKLDAISGAVTGGNTGDITLTAVGAVANANGASLSSQALTLQPVSTSFPGVMTAADKVKLDVLGITTAAMTLYVDPVSGSDSNDGLGSGTALLTLQAALYKIPLIIRHAVIVNIAAGTLADGAIVWPSYQISSAGALTIVGAIADFTPGSGIASGTLDAAWSGQAYDGVATCSGGGWGTDVLAGAFLQVTSGASNGSKIPILSNTATTITLPTPDISILGAGVGVTLKGQTFKFIKPATFVAKSTGENTSWTIISTPPASTVTLNPYSTLATSTHLTIARLAFTTSASSTAMFAVTRSGVRLSECTIGDKMTSAFTASTTSISYCHITTSTTPIVCYGSILNLSGSVIKSTANSGVGVALLSSTVFIQPQGNTLQCRMTFISMPGGTSSVGIQMQNCRNTSFASNVISGPATGISIENASTIVASPTVGNAKMFVIDSCVTAGISIKYGSRLIGNSNGGIYISGCGTGILMDDRSVFSLTSGGGILSVTGSTGYGVNLGNGITVGGGNSFTGNSSVVMSANTSGDFTLDGTAVTSLATLRATSPKRITDLTTFNCLAEA